MPATILTTDYYPAVRGLLSPDITADHMSDAYLSLDPFAPAAEREVRTRLRAEKIDADTLTGEALEVVRLAMEHECAAELCVAAPQLLRNVQVEILTQVQEINWKEKRAYHLSKVAEKITEASTIVTPSTPGTVTGRKVPFTAAGTERRDVEEPPYTSRRVPYYGG